MQRENRFVETGPIHEHEGTHEVARVFILRSNSVCDVRAELEKKMSDGQSFEAALNDFQFTHVILAEKNADSTETAGQLVPVGGVKKKTDRTVEGTARRELLEETHLRSADVEYLGDMNYEFQHTTKGTLDIHANFFVSHVLPLDSPYSQDPQEDKMNFFRALDHHEMARLWGDGCWLQEGDDTGLLLFDSLLTDGTRKRMKTQPVDFKSSVSLEEQANVWKIMGKLGEHMRAKELEKKKYILYLMSQKLCDTLVYNEFSQRVTETTSYSKIEQLFNEFVNEHSCEEGFGDAFFSSLEFSNYDEELMQAGRSRTEAVLRVIYTLLELHEKRDSYITLATTHPELKGLFSSLEMFATQSKILPNVVEGVESSESFYDFGHIDQKDKKEVERIFCDSFGINNPGVILNRITCFLDEMVSQGVDPAIGDEFHPIHMKELEEIKNASIYELLQYAGVTSKAKEQMEQRGFYGKNARELVFEARRKLALMFIMQEVDEYYTQVVEAGNGPIAKLWQNIMSAPLVYVSLQSIEADGELSDIKTLIGDKGGGGSQETWLRKLDVDGMSTLAQVDTRLKDLYSLYRKMIIRGYASPHQIQDMYARSVVFAPRNNEEKQMMQSRKKRRLSLCSFDDKGQVCFDDSEVEDSPVVFGLIDGLLKQAKKGEEIYIFDFKPTPAVNDNFKGDSPGSSPDMRFAKFYVKHVDKEGVERFEEVQVFTPTIDKSAFYWEKKKKMDDERYALSRLLQTRGLRSFIELLWPYNIYGDVVRKMHKKQS
ncbi:MAG: hypothetical protein COX81_02750 [Candidatus Magasanikbacteria bacterium CG_4_10_14_0_2_um_filter_37_12]|uniref:Nudix hydrolase domain-containing protein n=1 Tax=Candidatus Magasanikbacteria bacterium CG_4_10_14_0_2_um_filter_37_12 TaxID=1974637 RepID=A0A2M7V7L7_9BACT|nr:MAG: hypothetical protein COX81_02750 [Candidatus Magasanikbacteria bacterium CG_4_10_14_0_2_um_filter_37_12]